MIRRPTLGVILAAGRGQRMRLFTDRFPKPILPIANRPLIAHQLDMMRRMGVRRVIVVIGHLGAEIVRTLDGLAPADLDIAYHDQGELLGIAHAVGQLESKIDGPFVLFLGDIFFVLDDPQRLIAPFDDPAVKGVLSVREEPDPAVLGKNFAVLLDERGDVRRVIEKPRHASTRLKGCGLYLFDLEIFDAIRRTQRTALRDEYELTDSIQILIDDGYRVRAADSLSADINLTFPSDILQANLIELERMGLDRLVDPSAEVQGARLDRSVVGAEVRLAAGSRLERCLALPGARPPAAGQWRDRILFEDRSVSCAAEAGAGGD